MKRVIVRVVLLMTGLLLSGIYGASTSIADSSIFCDGVGNHDASTNDFPTTSLKDVKTSEPVEWADKITSHEWRERLR